MTRVRVNLDVMPMKETRASLPEIMRGFRANGAAAEPVFFGAHRKPVGVLLSMERYETLVDLVDDLSIALMIRERDANDTGERMTLDELIAAQGFTRAEIEADNRKRRWFGRSK